MAGKTILKKGPLVLMLFQVKFSYIGLMETEYIPKLQDKYRKKFPHYNTFEVHELNINVNKSVKSEKSWLFNDKNKFSGIFVSNDCITFRTTNYKGFDDAIKKFKEILQIFVAICDPGLVSRVGMRYVNVVNRIGEKQAVDFVKDSYKGDDFKDLSPKDIINHNAISMNIAPEILKASLVRHKQDRVLPPNLDETELEYPQGRDKIRGNLEDEVILLDLDCFHDKIEGMEFCINDIGSKFEIIHEYIKKAFLNFFTDEAIEIWSE